MCLNHSQTNPQPKSWLVEKLSSMKSALAPKMLWSQYSSLNIQFSSLNTSLHFHCHVIWVTIIFCLGACVFSHHIVSHFFVTPWTVVAHQAPLSMGLSRQEHWSGLSFPSPGDLPDPGVQHVSLMSPALASGFLTISSTWEAPYLLLRWLQKLCDWIYLIFFSCGKLNDAALTPLPTTHTRRCLQTNSWNLCRGCFSW